MKLAAALLAGVLMQSADLPVRVIDRGGQSGVEEQRLVAVSSAPQFGALWREHTTRPLPVVDFTRESVVALFLGTRRTAGYAVDIVSVSRSASGTLVTYRESSPSPGAISAQVLTFPYVIAAVPVITPPVRFESVR